MELLFRSDAHRLTLGGFDYCHVDLALDSFVERTTALTALVKGALMTLGSNVHPRSAGLDEHVVNAFHNTTGSQVVMFRSLDGSWCGFSRKYDPPVLFRTGELLKIEYEVGVPARGRGGYFVRLKKNDQAKAEDTGFELGLEYSEVSTFAVLELLMYLAEFWDVELAFGEFSDC